MSDIRHINEQYTEIGMELINTEPRLFDIRNSDCTIVFLSSELAKVQNTKIVFAQCEKVPDKYKWAVPADFCIVVFDPNVEEFTEEQLRILLFHELLHVGIDGDSYFVRPHDIEDFYEIIDRFGMHWSDTGGFEADIEELKINT